MVLGTTPNTLHVITPSTSTRCAQEQHSQLPGSGHTPACVDGGWENVVPPHSLRQDVLNTSHNMDGPSQAQRGQRCTSRPREVPTTVRLRHSSRRQGPGAEGGDGE